MEGGDQLVATIDDRVVQLKFDNKQFESETARSMSTLDKLKNSLNFTSSKKGIEDLGSAMSKLGVGPIAATIEGVNSKFLAMATIGITALTSIANKAIQVGATLVKSLTIDPVKQGFAEYETNLNSVQTILANTAASGATLKDVNAALAELNTYSDKTIYNFSEMARNIGTFTAAGVGLKESTAAIKGIANLAALSGSNSQQASTAMYQLSQALAAGRVSLMDWNSVVNAGMGGTVFQRALAQTAEKMGKLKDGAVKLTGPMKNVSIAGLSFRESISDPKVGGWLTSDVLTKTLQQFTGDMTDAQLAAEGFSATEIKAIQSQAKMAMEAATNVKTLSQVISVAKETAGSGWAQTWALIFGDFSEAKGSFTAMSNTINGFINDWSNARNSLLAGWKELGGRDAAIKAISNAFDALVTVVKPIKDAFREIFPAKTAKDLFNLTVAVRDFFAGLKISAETAAKVKRTFAGVFAIFSIAKSVISGIVGVVVDLAKSFSGIGGGLLDTTATIGDFFVKIDKAIKNGALIPFFQRLNAFMAPVNVLIRKIGEGFQAMFDGSFAQTLGLVGDTFGRVSQRLSPLQGLLSTLNTAWDRFLGVLQNVAPVFSQLLQNVQETFSQIPVIIQESVSNGNYSAILDTINTAIFGGIALMIRKFIKGGGTDLGGGFLDSITGTFGELTNTLKAMQEQIKSKVLLNIAIAVALLTASVVALSLIDSAKLAKALAGLAFTFAELLASMAILNQISKSAGFLKLPIIAASLILLSTAILILTGALKVLASMSWEELGKGLTGLAGILAMLDLAVKPIAANAKGMVAAGIGIAFLSGGILILSGAMKVMATMSWEEIARGLVGVAGALAIVIGAMRLMPGPMMILSAAGLVLVAGALTIIAGAMKVMATMSWEDIAKGLVAIAASMAILAIGLAAMEGAVPGAVALQIASRSLLLLAATMKILGTLEWDQIGKGLVAIAGSLVILAAGLYLMEGAILGAAALIVASEALVILSAALKVLGSMSWEEIGKGLVALAGAFAVIGLAALLLTPVIPQIIALAAAIALLGIGVALIGAGVLAFATAMTALVAIGSLGVVALTAILQTAIGIIPTVFKALELAIVAFAEAIAAAAPAIIAAITVILIGIMDMIIKLTPKIYQTLGVLLDGFLAFALRYIPKLVDVGLQLINGILKGIAKNLPNLIKNGTAVIVAWIKGIGAATLQIVKAAGETLITFMNGVTTWINQNQQRMNTAGRNLVKAIIDGMISGIGAYGSGVLDAIAGLAGSAIDKAKEILHINSPSKVFIEIGKGVTEGFVLGIVAGKNDTVNATNAITNNLKAALTNATKNVADLKKKVAELSSKPMTSANKAALAKAKAALKAAVAEQAKLNSAYKTVTVEHKKQIADLKNLAGQYDVVKGKLEEAQKVLDEAVKKRDDYAKQISDKFGVLPGLDNTSSLDDYFNAIRNATAANLKFKETLEKLRNLGLDDNQYKRFLEQGTEIQPFLDQLLAAGGDTVDELNKIDVTLTESATSLGKSASEALYQAGVDSAQGLVDGLTAQMTVITDKMKAIGKAIADEIKKELGIKSPSKVFKEIGTFTMQGLAQGIDQNTNVVDISARRAGQIAVESLQKSLSNIGDVALDELDLQPKIAPVIDLTEFRKDVSTMNGLIKDTPVIAQVSMDSANSAAIAAEANKQALNDIAALQNTGTTVEFTQVNNSPKALSSTEIYRQTKNQLTVLKGATGAITP